MSERQKLLLLLVLVGVLVGVYVLRRPSAPTGPLATTGSGASRPGAGARKSNIPDATLQVERLEAAARGPQGELRRNIFEYGHRTEAPASSASQTEASAAPPPAPPPPPPPAPVRFYGFADNRQGGPRRVFLTDGEQVYVAAEGDVIMRRYRLLRVKNDSIEVEELTGKQRWVVPLEQP